MSILALDLGTKCGWAFTHAVKPNIFSGVENLKPSTHESAGQRWIKFSNFLRTNQTKWDLVVYEEVHMHIGVEAAHVYGGLVAILQSFCLERGIEYRGVGVGTIKKHATGKGNAKKDAMISAAIKMYPSINIIDDNQADALCLLHYAEHKLLI